MSDTATTVSVSKCERNAEIDARIVAKMALLDDRRSTYMRGFWDCLYILAAVAWAVYLLFFYGKEE
jgi:hypothetical protein